MGNLLDLTGKRFGKLIVLAVVGRNKFRQALWKVRCECGTVRTVIGNKMVLGLLRSCGCMAVNKPVEMRPGTVFGRLTIISRAKNKSDSSRAYMYNVRCLCGTKCVVAGNRLRFGSTRSCGCLVADTTAKLNYIHGATGTTTYTAWTAMRARVDKKNAVGWKNYGGRGITYCRRWNVYVNFLADMGERPPGLSLDRINNNGNYTPKNCRWATRTQQNNNQRPRKDRKIK